MILKNTEAEGLLCYSLHIYVINFFLTTLKNMHNPPYPKISVKGSSAKKMMECNFENEERKGRVCLS